MKDRQPGIYGRVDDGWWGLPSHATDAGPDSGTRIRRAPLAADSFASSARGYRQIRWRDEALDSIR